MKDFSALQGLRRDLQEQEKRAQALAERQRQEAQPARKPTSSATASAR
jgi:hypothetical protein